MPKYNQGFFKPRNPEKYKGDPTNIVFRSGWEKNFMVFCDNRPDIIEWSSEEFAIPYRHPITGRIHRYFPDFKIKIRKKDGMTETLVVEIKPDKETKPPKVQTRKTKRYINEVKTYAINKYKWDHAITWCKDRGYRFVVFTEKHLFEK